MLAETSMTGEKTDDVDAGGDDTERSDDHIAEIDDGAGCTEIWEHLSRQRAADDD